MNSECHFRINMCKAKINGVEASEALEKILELYKSNVGFKSTEQLRNISSPIEERMF